MQELITDLARRLESLEAENRALAARVRELEGSPTEARRASLLPAGAAPGPDRSEDVVSRRGLLRHLGTAAAAAGGLIAASSALGPEPAGAVAGNMRYGASNDAGVDTTWLESSGILTFAVDNDARAAQAGLMASLTERQNRGIAVLGGTAGLGIGVAGNVSNARSNGIGVYGVTNGTGTAVHAQTTGSGHAVKARSERADNNSSAVEVVHDGLGRGVEVRLPNAANASAGFSATTAGSGRAIFGKTTGSGWGLHTVIDNVANSRPSALAQTNGTGPGVEGISTRGVGGRFTGAGAQVRLVASRSAAPPPEGVRGDLFVDSTGRLWFCKGGADWRQLA